MFESFWDTIVHLLGLGEDTHPSITQMALRGLVTYLYALALVRIGETRFIGKNTAFDFLLGIMLGSIISRAITGNAPFFASLLTATVLVFLHWLFAAVGFRSDRFATLVKGERRALMRHGEVQWENMRRAHIGERDLLKSLRSNASSEQLEQVENAYLERTGEISFIPKQQEAPRVVEVSVAAGVQTVRIELE